MNPKKPRQAEKDLNISSTGSENEWNYDSKEWEYTYDPQDTYDYDYPRGPVCKVVWVKSGKKYEKEYSRREHALEKQKSLLLKEIPAVIKGC